MYLVAIAWLYITLLMAFAEATHANGSWLGAVITFVLYGVGPLALVLYLLNTPHRRRALREREQAQADADAPLAAPGSDEPDAGSQPPTSAAGGLVSPERKEP